MGSLLAGWLVSCKEIKKSDEQELENINTKAAHSTGSTRCLPSGL